jgi:hypothetical protein
MAENGSFKKDWFEALGVVELLQSAAIQVAIFFFPMGVYSCFGSKRIGNG